MAKRTVNELERISTLHPYDDWHEDYGSVLWHHLDEYGGLCEAPIVSRGDEDLEGHQPWDNYYAYWSHLPHMDLCPLRSAKIAPDFHRILICDGWHYVDG